MCPYGRFTHAVVRGIPETFGKTAGDSRENGEISVDLAKAQRQFGCLTGALRQKVGLQLIEIPPDPELPESWRIEDVAVIQGDTALITRPFKQQRRSEVKKSLPSIIRLLSLAPKDRCCYFFWCSDQLLNRQQLTLCSLHVFWCCLDFFQCYVMFLAAGSWVFPGKNFRETHGRVSRPVKHCF